MTYLASLLRFLLPLLNQARWLAAIVCCLVGLNQLIAAALHFPLTRHRQPAVVSIAELEAGRIPSFFVKVGEHLAGYPHGTLIPPHTNQGGSEKLLYPVWSAQHPALPRAASAGPLVKTGIFVLAPVPPAGVMQGGMVWESEVTGVLEVPDESVRAAISHISDHPSPLVLRVGGVASVISPPLLVGVGLAFFLVGWALGSLPSRWFDADSPTDQDAQAAAGGPGATGAVSASARPGGYAPARAWSDRPLPGPAASLPPVPAARPGGPLVQAGTRVTVRRGARTLTGTVSASEAGRCRIEFDDGRVAWIATEEVVL